METKSIEQIKEEYAGEHGRDSWEEFFQWNTLCHTPHDIMQDHYNEIMKRYAQQFQSPTSFLNTEIMALRERVEELEAWKESAKNVLSNLKLQELGKVLDIKLGEDISSNVFPKVKSLNERVGELEDMLMQSKTVLENRDKMSSKMMLTVANEIESLINKSK